MEYDADDSDLAAINAKVEELHIVYPAAIVDYSYDVTVNGILFKAKVTRLPGEDQETSSLNASEIESFLTDIIEGLQ